jgi:hypothetical protein
VVLRLEPPSICAQGFQLISGFLLGRQIRFNIYVRGLDAFMAKPQGNYAEVDAGLEQV